MQFINLDLAFYYETENVSAAPVWGKHQRSPDKLSSSSSCCLPITFNGFTKNTDYLQEKRGF